MLAIVNPAAGGGRCGQQADAVLARAEGVARVVRTERPGHATELARQAHGMGERRFLAVGGDGTAFEVVNGLMDAIPSGERVTLGFLPLGTGNSFLRDFSTRGVDHVLDCLADNRTRSCDVMKLTHRDGVLYSINLLCLGFPAAVAAVTNRRFKRLGQLGYILGVLTCLARLPRRPFPRTSDGARDDEELLYLTFANSRFTGGKMMIAPEAVPDDGLIEEVIVRPMGRFALLRAFPRIFKGTSLELPQVSRRPATEVLFHLDAPVDIMVDGEVLTVWCEKLEILPGALDIVA